METLRDPFEVSVNVVFHHQIGTVSVVIALESETGDHLIYDSWAMCPEREVGAWVGRVIEAARRWGPLGATAFAGQTF